MNILEKIAQAIYWKGFTQKQTDWILNTLSHGDSPMFKANDICEYLGIEKRGNRQAIYNIICSMDLGDISY